MRKWWVLFFIVITSLFLVYNYIYQDHRDIKTEQASYSTTAKALQLAFVNTPATSQKKYLDQSIEISGKVSKISKNAITLNGSIFCVFLDKNNSIKINQTLTVKGRFVGYDDLLEEIKLDQCSVTNKN